MNPLNISIPEAARALGVGRSMIYTKLATRELIGVKIGSRRLVTVASVMAFADSLAMEGA